MKSSLALLLLSLVLPVQFTWADGPGTSWQVTFSVVGDGQTDVEPEAATGFVASLDARDGVTATAVKSGWGTQSWIKASEGVQREQWLSLTAVCLGSRQDWVAIHWAAADTVAWAYRRPGRLPLAGIRRDWPVPGAKQYSINAVKELAADVASPPARRAPANRGDTVIPLRIEAWKSGAGDAGLTPAGSAVIEAVKVLACAAAPGRARLAAAGEDATVVEVARTPMGLKLRGQRGERKLELFPAPMEQIHDHLTLLLAWLDHGSPAVRQIFAVGTEPVSSLAWRDGVLVAQTGTEFAGWDPAKAQIAWRNDGGEYAQLQRHKVALRIGARAMQCLPADGRQAWVGGDLRRAAPEQIEFVDGLLASVIGTQVMADLAGERRWVHDFAAPVTTRPGVVGDLVIVGDDSGVLTALARDSGDVKWAAQLTGRLRGDIVGNQQVVFTASMEGDLFAVRSADGAVIGKATLGDLPLTPVILDGADVLLVVAPGQVTRRPVDDPATVKASWSAPLPVTGMALCDVVTPALLAVATRDELVLLSAADLKELSRAPLLGVVAAAPLPVGKWPNPASDWLAEEGKPALLLGDGDGFVTVFDLPGIARGQ